MSSSSSDAIQFYYHPWNRGAVVHWMLEEVGAPYEVHLLNYKKGSHNLSCPSQKSAGWRHS